MTARGGFRTALTPPRALDAADAEAFLETLIDIRLREFRTLALLLGGDDIDLDSLDRAEADIRAACEASLKAVRARLVGACIVAGDT